MFASTLIYSVALATILSAVQAIPMTSHTWFMGGRTLAAEMVDPIVNPNNVGGHQHRIFGGSGFGANYNYEDYMNAKCTSVDISVDKSVYWAPQLYWVNGGVNGSNPSFVPLDGELRIYYINTRNTPSTPVSPFPKGLRMLVGSPNSKTPMTSYNYFTCQVRQDFVGNLASTDFNFQRNCPMGMKSEITFPSCWNGQSLYNKDQSHMAFPAGGQPCPVSHPIRIPAIRMEITWWPEKWAAGVPMAGNLAWANGDTTGYGMHADFVNAWDTTILAAALNNTACVGDQLPNPTRFQECPNFSPFYTTPACSPDRGIVQNPQGNSDWVPISTLPGCNPLWGASGPKPTCNPPVAPLDVTKIKGVDGSLIPDVSDQVNYTLPSDDGWHYVACTSVDQSFLVNQVSYGAQMTIGECQTSCLKAGMLWAGMTPAWDGSNVYTCSCGSDLADKTPISDGCNAPCPGDSTQNCGSNASGNLRVSIFYATPSTLDQVRGLVSQGCYGEPFVNSNGLRGLSQWSYQDSANSGSKCLQACINHDSTYTWAATRNGNMCYCGSSFSLGTGFWRPDSQCQLACPGNSSQTCGSSTWPTLNVYNLTASSIAAQNMTAMKFPGWQGCYPETASGFALSGNAFTSSLMTPSLCVNGCSELNYTMAGVEQGNLCLCGNTQTPTPILPATSCSRACGGDGNQTCGEYRVFEAFTTIGATTTPATIAATKPPGYLGCYYTPDAASQSTPYSFSSGLLTVESCTAGCVSMNYKYGMVQLQTCRCDNNPLSASIQSLSRSCTTACRGNSSETCGSSFYTEVYDAVANGAQVQGNDRSGYVGCRTDPAGTAVGTSVFSFKQTDMTISLCTQSCQEIGQPVATLEGGQRCICGPQWPSSGWTLLPDNQCTTPCGGNSSAICGSASAGSVYNSSVGKPVPPHPSGWIGCFPTSSNVKIISGATQYSDKAMTSALCRTSCASRGGTYAAVFSGNQCLCGTSLSGSAQAPSSQCNVACYGNSTENCGSANFADLYTTTGALAPNNGVNGYMGCFTDFSVLATNQYSSTYINGQTCSLACAQAGFAYAATQPGKCRCGNTAPSLMTSDDYCNSPCVGMTNGEMCGSSATGSVYRSDPTVQYPAPSVVLNGINGYQGCYTLNSLTAAVSYTSDTAMTIASCIANCGELGYYYGGLWQYKRCTCGSNISFTSTNYRIADSSCTGTCSGDGNPGCGGNAGMALYSVGDSGIAPTSAAALGDGYQGCFAAGTSITGAGYTYKTTMEPNLCRRTCRNKGFSVSALSVTNQCSCSNGALYGTQRLTSTCAAPCNGNSSTICGYSDTSLVSIYDATGQGSLPPQGFPTNYVGCFGTSDVKGLTLFSVSGYGKLNSATCSAMCTARGQGTYIGTMSGNQCYCLSGLPAVLQRDALCSTGCSNSPGENCGGGGSYISVYREGQAASSSIPVSTIASTTSVATNTSIATFPNATASATFANSTQVSATITSNATFATASVTGFSGTAALNSTTPAKTVNATTVFASTATTGSTSPATLSPNSTMGSNSTVASGTQSGAASSAASSTVVGSANSTAIASSIIGGSANTATATATATATGTATGTGSAASISASSIASTASSTSSAAPQATRAVLEGYTYRYCLQDSTARSMNYTYAKNSNLTPSLCMNLCSGFQYFGVEGSDTCFCSNALNSNVTLPDTECNFACTSSTSQLCGGSNAIALYQSNTPISSAASSTGTSTRTATASSAATSTATSLINNEHLVSTTASAGCQAGETVTTTVRDGTATTTVVQTTVQVQYVTVTAGNNGTATATSTATHTAGARSFFGLKRKSPFKSRSRFAYIKA